MNLTKHVSAQEIGPRPSVVWCFGRGEIPSPLPLTACAVRGAVPEVMRTGELSGPSPAAAFRRVIPALTWTAQQSWPSSARCGSEPLKV